MQIESSRKYILGAGLLLFVLILFGYTLFESRFLILGPTINIESPLSGEILSDPIVTIHGRAQNITHITLNDRPIFTDEEGYFSEKLLLGMGYTIMKVRVEDRFGRNRETFLHLVHN